MSVVVWKYAQDGQWQCAMENVWVSGRGKGEGSNLRRHERSGWKVIV